MYIDKLMKNSGFLMLSKLIGSGCGLLFWLVASRYYSSENIGLAVTMLAAMNMIANLSLCGLNISIISYLPEERDKSGLLNTCSSTIMITSLVLSSTFLIFLNYLVPSLHFIHEHISSMLIFILMTMFTALLLQQTSVFVSFREAQWPIVQNVFGAVRLVVLPLFISIASLGIFVSYGSGIVLALLIGNIVLMRLLRNHRFALLVNKDTLSKMATYAYKNYISNIVQSAPIFLMPIMISNILGSDSSAYFYIPWTLATALFLIPDSVSMSLLAERSALPKSASRNALKSLCLVALLMVPAIITLSLFSESILSLYGNGFAESSTDLLVILAISAIFVAINAIYLAEKRAKREMNYVIILVGAITSAALLGGYVCLITYGLIGIGYAWLLSNGIVALFVLYSYGKQYVKGVPNAAV